MQVIRQRYWVNPDAILSWRAINPYCATQGGDNTGYLAYNTLEEYDTADGVATGSTKPNSSGDPDYVPAVYDEATCPLPVPTDWRPVGAFCVQDSSENTGYLAYQDLEEYETPTGNATGVVKPNSSGDPDYVAPKYNESVCPLPLPEPEAVLDWRPVNPYCIQEDSDNTGYLGYHILEEYDTANGAATGVTKPNNSGDPDYVAPVLDEATCPIPVPVLGWRPIDQYCVKDGSDNTGYLAYQNLEEYDEGSGVATGNTKPNSSGDPDHVAPVLNESACPIPQYEWEGYQPSCEIAQESTQVCEGFKGDAVFILDITNSMNGPIDNLKTSLSDIAGKMRTQFPEGYRLSLVTVTDGGNPYQIRVPLSENNETEIQGVLETLTAGGGNDTPEPTDLALQGILNNEAGLLGGSDTVKSIFIITDAIPKEGQAGFGGFYPDFIQGLSDEAASRNIKLFPIAVGVGADPTKDFYADVQQAHDIYANTTGGVKYNIQSGVVDSSIISAIQNESCELTTYYVNTGMKAFDRIRLKSLDTGEYVTNKINDPADPDYVLPIYDPNYCQEGRLYIELDRYEENVSTGAGSIVAQVYSNTEWIIGASSPYLRTDFGNEGTHNGQAVVGYDENTGDERLLIFSVTSAAGGVSKSFKIYQEGVIQYNSVTLAKSYSADKSCSDFTEYYRITRYIDGNDFDFAQKLFTDSSGNNPAPSGWYSNGSIVRYWTGNSFTSDTVCRFM